MNKRDYGIYMELGMDADYCDLFYAEKQQQWVVRLYTNIGIRIKDVFVGNSEPIDQDIIDQFGVRYVRKQ